jgi:membrane peptidoglycan carboxypeptidase
VTIRRILDRHGKVLYQNVPKPQKTLNPGVSFLLTQALTGVFQPGGTASNIGPRINYPAAGKTGTTEANRDAWFVGYTPTLLAMVFIGCDHNERSLPGVASAVAAPIWADFMGKAVSGETPVDFPVPKEIIRVSICRESRAKATAFCPRQEEYFLVGTEPADYCEVHRTLRLQICEKSGLLPGPYCRHLTERDFHLGDQPVDTCDRCRPKIHIFEWMRRWFGD